MRVIFRVSGRLHDSFLDHLACNEEPVRGVHMFSRQAAPLSPAYPLSSISLQEAPTPTRCCPSCRKPASPCRPTVFRTVTTSTAVPCGYSTSAPASLPSTLD
ncbi:hypothetical protein BU25DRAFT_405386 [Macroventuria anomochaeta]|uniref:Uncharacterized protein n=1 Tax=Macroventuria anomochaeta TaxID=301207 RepID=A0ACB6SJ92_9PLEO|nr:uncharacterized protein BU25DRAFT_405386 [Macroventuria anomochaeta]KAF2633504.1 hypothetical protein BU25DRAFT_405386 [Macroventuria anomochaeta]